MISKFLRTWVLYPLEAIIANVMYFLMGLIPFDPASHIGGWIGRKIGPHLKVSNIARQNLKAVFTQKSDAEIEEIVKGVWENLGRAVFEFPHISKINIYEQPDRFEIIGLEHVRAMHARKNAIFYSAHMANWEFTPSTVAQHTPPLPVHLIYREPNNPYMRKMFAKRKPTPECGLIPKGVKGAREAMSVLKKGGYLGILVDQKMNDGILVPLMGREAMTAPAMAQFALRFDCPLVPVRSERIDKTRFRLTFYEPVYVEKTDDKAADILKTMTEVNKNLGDWIMEKPEQWLWMHRRWPKN